MSDLAPEALEQAWIAQTVEMRDRIKAALPFLSEYAREARETYEDMEELEMALSRILTP